MPGLGHKVEGVKVFWTVPEVAEYLSVKPSTVYSWVRRNELSHYKIGRIVRFKKEDIDLWMEGHRKEKDGAGKRAKAILRDIRRPVRNIDQLVRKSIAEVKKREYTPNYGRPDQDKGLGKEVSDGSL